MEKIKVNLVKMTVETKKSGFYGTPSKAYLGVAEINGKIYTFQCSKQDTFRVQYTDLNSKVLNDFGVEFDNSALEAKYDELKAVEDQKEKAAEIQKKEDLWNTSVVRMYCDKMDTRFKVDTTKEDFMKQDIWSSQIITAKYEYEGKCFTLEFRDEKFILRYNYTNIKRTKDINKIKDAVDAYIKGIDDANKWQKQSKEREENHKKAVSWNLGLPFTAITNDTIYHNGYINKVFSVKVGKDRTILFKANKDGDLWSYEIPYVITMTEVEFKSLLKILGAYEV